MALLRSGEPKDNNAKFTLPKKSDVSWQDIARAVVLAFQ